MSTFQHCNKPDGINWRLLERIYNYSLYRSLLVFKDKEFFKLTSFSLNTGRKSNNNKTNSGWPPYPEAPPGSKEYQPGAFTDNNTSKAIEENTQLKAKVMILLFS